MHTAQQYLMSHKHTLTDKAASLTVVVHECKGSHQPESTHHQHGQRSAQSHGELHCKSLCQPGIQSLLRLCAMWLLKVTKLGTNKCCCWQPQCHRKLAASTLCFCLAAVSDSTCHGAGWEEIKSKQGRTWCHSNAFCQGSAAPC